MTRLLLLAALLAAGCASEAPPADDAAAPPAETVEATEAAPSSVGYEAVMGGPDRLTVLASDGAETTVAFGTPQAEATAALAPTLGPPAAESQNPDCPAGPTTVLDWENGLSLLFVDGALGGWRALGDDERLMTPEGVQLGTPRDLLFTTPGVAPDEASPFDDAFLLTADGGTVGGFLDGPGDGALVMELFAGHTCTAS